MFLHELIYPRLIIIAFLASLILSSLIQGSINLLSKNISLSRGNQIIASNNLAGHIDYDQLNDAIERLADIQQNFSKHGYSTTGLMLGELHWLADQKVIAVEVWKTNKISPNFFMQLPISTWSDQEFQMQLSKLDRAYNLDPDRGETAFYLGLTYELMENFEQAEFWYEQAQKSENWQDNTLAYDVYYRRGLLLIAQGKVEEAETTFRSALEFAEKSGQDRSVEAGQIHRQLGLIHQQRGELTLARKEFEIAIKANPDDIWNYFSLALVFSAEGESSETVFHYFNIANEINPNNKHAYIYPANYYLGQQEEDLWAYFCGLTPSHLRISQDWKDVCE